MRWRVMVLTGLAASFLAAGPPKQSQSEQTTNELLPPVRLEAAGKPIDTAVGHAAPFVCDYFGNGKKDLLVGQFGEGLLWLFRNEGTDTQPKFAAGIKFKEGAKGGRVPTG